MMKISEILLNVSKLKKDEQSKYIDGLLAKFKNNPEMIETLFSIKSDPPESHSDVYCDLYAEAWNMKDACEYLEKSESTIRRWIKDGILKADKKSNEYFFDYVELKRVKNLIKNSELFSDDSDENAETANNIDKKKVLSEKPKRLSIEKAAEYLNKSVITLRRWIQSGKIKAFQIRRKYEFNVEYLKQIKDSIDVADNNLSETYCSNAIIDLECLMNDKVCRYTVANNAIPKYNLEKNISSKYIAANENVEELSRCA